MKTFAYTRRWAVSAMAVLALGAGTAAAQGLSKEVIKLGLGAAQIKTNAQGVVVGAILIVSAILDVLRRRVKKY